MVESIENRLCACKSGKRYKDCCLKRKYILSEVPYKIYDEDYVLSGILDKDEVFSNFYKNERGNISKYIYWAHNKNPKSNASFGTIQYNNKLEYMIMVNSIPVSSENSFDVAHELQHIICSEEGYPIVRCVNPVDKESRINKIIANMINDPIVNERIMKYDFNMWHYFDYGNKKQCKTIGIRPIEQQNTENLLLLTTLYVKKTLEWDIVNIKGERDINDYNIWFEKNYPSLIPQAKQLLDIVKTIGYDNPSKVGMVLKEVIRELNLSNFLEVISL